MTMNRRALIQQVLDLRRELDEALSRAEAAEQELRLLRDVDLNVALSDVRVLRQRVAELEASVATRGAGGS